MLMGRMLFDPIARSVLKTTHELVPLAKSQKLHTPGRLHPRQGRVWASPPEQQSADAANGSYLRQVLLISPIITLTVFHSDRSRSRAFSVQQLPASCQESEHSSISAVAYQFLRVLLHRFEDMHEHRGARFASGAVGGLPSEHAPTYTRKLLQGDQAKTTYLSGRVRQVHLSPTLV